MRRHLQTRVVRVDAAAPDPALIAEAAHVLRSGGLVAFPTETVYGLGADALDEVAVGGVFEAKGRPAGNPLIVHVDTVGQARTVARWSPDASRLAEAFWPGPLTLVLPRLPVVPDAVTAGGPTVAVRLPAHPVALALVRASGRPIAAPSANRSTRVSATTAAHVLDELDGRIDMVLDAGPTPGGLESTVIDLSTADLRVLRPGPVTPTDLSAALGAAVRAGEQVGGGPQRSPGSGRRHYAPQVPVVLAAGDAGSRAAQEAAGGRSVGLLAIDALTPQPLPARVRIIRLAAEPAGYARGLYAAIRALERSGVEVLVIELPPAGEPWEAVHDRLARAAARE